MAPSDEPERKTIQERRDLNPLNLDFYRHQLRREAYLDNELGSGMLTASSSQGTVASQFYALYPMAPHLSPMTSPPPALPNGSSLSLSRLRNVVSTPPLSDKGPDTSYATATPDLDDSSSFNSGKAGAINDGRLPRTQSDSAHLAQGNLPRTFGSSLHVQGSSTHIRDGSQYLHNESSYAKGDSPYSQNNSATISPELLDTVPSSSTTPASEHMDVDEESFLQMAGRKNSRRFVPRTPEPQKPQQHDMDVDGPRVPDFTPRPINTSLSVTHLRQENASAVLNRVQSFPSPLIRPDTPPWEEQPANEDIEILGLVSINVIEARGLCVKRDINSKPYVLLQYDHTDSVSRPYSSIHAYPTPTLPHQALASEPASGVSSPLISRPGSPGAGAAASRPETPNQQLASYFENLSTRSTPGSPNLGTGSLGPTPEHGSSSPAKSASSGPRRRQILKRGIQPTSSVRSSHNSKRDSPESHPLRLSVQTAFARSDKGAPRNKLLPNNARRGTLPRHPSRLALQMTPAEHNSDAAKLRDTPKITNEAHPANAVWNHKAMFDVTHNERFVHFYVYDMSVQEDNSNPASVFLGAAKYQVNIAEEEDVVHFNGWLPLTNVLDPNVQGQIHVDVTLDMQHQQRPPVSVNDFFIEKRIGEGSFGQVFLVRKADTARMYAMKVIPKNKLESRTVRAHIRAERQVLMQARGSPFLVGLKFSFQTDTDLFLVMDLKSGGELFTHLQRYGGRFEEARVRFYLAEIVIGLGHLHAMGVVYRDLKPENCLLSSSGHVVLVDFGLSKSIPPGEKTSTFCGTTEYIAPEILLGNPYDRRVDFWSLGVLLFEMCNGWSPFYAESKVDAYEKILSAPITLPTQRSDSSESRDLLLRLLIRDPDHRIGSRNGVVDIEQHPFFASVSWADMARQRIAPPYVPEITADADYPIGPDSVYTPSRWWAPDEVLTPNTTGRLRGFSFRGGAPTLISRRSSVADMP